MAVKISLRSVIAIILLGAFINQRTYTRRFPSGTTSVEPENGTPNPPTEEGKNHVATVTEKQDYEPVLPIENLSKEYKICRVVPSPQIDQPPVQMKGRGLPILYQCAGKPYEDFMHKVYGFIEGKSMAQPTAEWGRRNSIFPKFRSPNSPKQRRLLIIGNSHTQQVAASLLCEYGDDINISRALVPSTSNKYVANEYFLETHGNLTIYVIFDHPFVYSKTWKATLEIDILKHPLHELDAIVLGSFNEYRESRGTGFLNTTLVYQKEFPMQGVDFERIQAPTVEDFVKVYGGPIIWVGMFAHYNTPIHKQAVEVMKTLSVTHHRDNLRSVNGRNYIDELGGEECSSNVRERVATCITDRTDPAFKNGFRCNGRIGGQADLVAWDVLDTLHHVLKHQMMG